MRHSVTWRIATQDELERTGCTDGADLISGAAAILVDGELRGVCDEYGTCVWSGYDEPDALDRGRVDAIERLNEAAVEL